MRTFLLAVVLTAWCASAFAGSFEISAEQWARPRSGSGIVAFESLQQVVASLEKQPEAVLTIHYAGGDEGLLWAEELRGWLIALGIAGEKLVLRPGLQQHDRVVLETVVNER